MLPSVSAVPRFSRLILVFLRADRFSSSSENMNSDIVYTLCPYLDLRSLFALAAAYPIFSPLGRKYMEKEKLKVKLKLVSDVPPAYSS